MKKNLVRDPNYYSLEQVLDQAYQRCSQGKGLERHATGNEFLEQPIITEGKAFGINPHLYQIRKKALEVLRMEPEAAQRELLDIIVYSAAAYLILREA